MMWRRRLRIAKIGRWKAASLAGLLFIAASGSAESDDCPWLNKATASGVLNAPVILKMQKTADGQAVCIFLGQSPAASNLSIVVKTINGSNEYVGFSKSQCTSPVIHLRAIGNEAEQCSVETGHSRREQVMGFVRDREFVVSINIGAGDESSVSRESLRQKVKNVAEQVAGSLF